MNSWACLHNYSFYSLLHSPSKPIKIAERAVQVGLPAIALTDEGCITGSAAFMKALKNTCECGHHKNSHSDTQCYGNNKTCPCTFPAKDIKPSKTKAILGTELNVRYNENYTSKLILLSKNLTGWKKLISITSEANKQENIYRDVPSISLDDLSKFCDRNLIGISGYYNSEIANSLFDNPYKIYFTEDYDAGRSLSSGKNFKKAVELAGKHRDIFGKDNFYLERQLFNKEAFSGLEVLSNAMKAISQKTGIPCVAGTNCTYPYPEDFDDQRILICSDLDTNYNDVDRKFTNPEHSWLKPFFDSKKNYIPSPEEIIPYHEGNADDIKNSLEIAEQCENYSILSKPILPVFNVPTGQTPDEYLKYLCVKGWKERIDGVIPKDKIETYKKQIREELQVIQGAGLSSYFLIVEDYCRAARDRGELLGNGRGSAAGSLISYLTYITKVDPVKYGLMFERFYNAGRNTADRVSLPDIDTDFENREAAIEYINNKYGKDYVGQMVTFARILGKGSLKEVFRIKFPDIPLKMVETITKALPHESEINDKLQEMKEAGEEPSIIMWALEAHAKELKPYCYFDENGRLQGEYSIAFRQAIKLEGTKKSQSKHPSGVVIANNKLADIVPMVYDKTTKKSVAGMEMNDLEDMGMAKFDILEVAVLRKLHGVANLLATGRVD